MLNFHQTVLCQSGKGRLCPVRILGLCLGTIIVLGGCAAPEPTVSISAEPSSIEQGESTTLKWSSENAESVSLDQ